MEQGRRGCAVDTRKRGLGKTSSAFRLFEHAFPFRQAGDGDGAIFITFQIQQAYPLGIAAISRCHLPCTGGLCPWPPSA